MARDIAVAALIAFSAGLVSGVIRTTALTIRSKGRRNSVVGLSLDLLEVKVRRLMGDSRARFQCTHRRLIGPAGSSHGKDLRLCLHPRFGQRML